MRELRVTEQKEIDGGIAPIAVFVAKVAWAGFKHWRTLRKASMAVQAAEHLGSMAATGSATYAGMGALENYMTNH